MTHDVRTRRRQGRTDRRYAELVSLYNAGLDHLHAVLADPQLREVSWPIPEFSGKLQRQNRFSGTGAAADTTDNLFELPIDWNRPAEVKKLVEVVDSLKLDSFEVNKH